MGLVGTFEKTRTRGQTGVMILDKRLGDQRKERVKKGEGGLSAPANGKSNSVAGNKKPTVLNREKKKKKQAFLQVQYQKGRKKAESATLHDSTCLGTEWGSRKKVMKRGRISIKCAFLLSRNFHQCTGGERSK